MGTLYALDGHKIKVAENVVEWGNWMRTNERHVADQDVDGVRVSTVFLGIDHRFATNGPPILFETMVFGGHLDGEMKRYETWEQAEAGHRKIVERVIQEGSDGLTDKFFRPTACVKGTPMGRVS